MLVRLSQCLMKSSLLNSKRIHEISIVRTMSIRLFEEKNHASLYSSYRPTYPEKVYEKISDYCHDSYLVNNSFNLAVDVGCGSGQSTVPLCKLFKHVIGYDVSDQQIAHAPKDIENLSFKVGSGEDLSFLEDKSVDLITVAQALHWFNLDLFYPEVRRVVKPGGVFVGYGYGTCYFKNELAQEAFMQFYSDLIGPYWDQQRRHIEDEYRNLGHPFKHFTRIDSDDIQIHRNMSVNAFVGYLSSMSAWQCYLKQYPDSDSLDQYRKKFENIYPDGNVDVYWKVFMLIGRKDI
ncbi:hypothetical protein ACF0H5_016832 [Mactra antiquata]